MRTGETRGARHGRMRSPEPARKRGDRDDRPRRRVPDREAHPRRDDPVPALRERRRAAHRRLRAPLPRHGGRPGRPGGLEDAAPDRAAGPRSRGRELVHPLRRAARHARLLELSHDAVLGWSLDEGIEIWNRGAEKLFGFTVAEARGRVSAELLRTTYPRPWKEIEVELRERSQWQGELVQRTKDGRTVTVSSKMQMLRGDDGIERVLETVHDISERVRVQAERDRLAQQQQLALDAARMGWWHHDPANGIATYDDRFKEIFGVSGHEHPDEEIP